MRRRWGESFGAYPAKRTGLPDKLPNSPRSRARYGKCNGSCGAHRCISWLAGAPDATNSVTSVKGKEFIASAASLLLLDLEEALAVFHGLTVLYQGLKYGSLRFSLNFVHDLHGFNDAND